MSFMHQLSSAVMNCHSYSFQHSSTHPFIHVPHLLHVVVEDDSSVGHGGHPFKAQHIVTHIQRGVHVYLESVIGGEGER